MSSSNLRMRDIRRHPAVITRGNELKIGLEVVRCHFVEPAGRSLRTAQAIMALIDKEGDISRREAVKAGYRHTPAWGIMIDHVATVKNFRASVFAPFIGLEVTQSSSVLKEADKFERCTAHSVDSVSEVIDSVPLVEEWGSYGEKITSREIILEYGDLGLAQDPYKLNHILFDRSKLPQNSQTA